MNPNAGLNSNKPKYSWEEYKSANPDTKHTHITYVAGSFTKKEVRGKKHVGDIFRIDGSEWRIVGFSENPFGPILAVPAQWVDEYWL
ncbi:hypothetical protein ACI2KR_06410 [Pseudomonas luteola]